MPIGFYKTERGFGVGYFVDLYGELMEVQDSSLATKAATWIGLKGQRRAHLDQDMARALIVVLQRFVDTGSILHAADEDANANPGMK